MKKFDCSTLQAELQALGWRLLNRLNPFKFDALSKLCLQLENHGKLQSREFSCWRARNLLIEVLRTLDQIGWDNIYSSWQPAEVTSWSLTGGVKKVNVFAQLRRANVMDLIASCPC